MKGFIVADKNWCMCECACTYTHLFFKIDKAWGCEKGGKPLSHTLLHTAHPGMCMCVHLLCVQVCVQDKRVCVPQPHNHVLRLCTVS